MRHYIYFSDKQEKEPVGAELRTLIKAVVYASLDYEGFERSAEVSVTFTDNDGIRLFNREYRDIDAPTDVLSFPIMRGDDGDADLDPATGAVLLGDIVLSLERAREQASLYGHSYTREVAFLTVHSILHLLGYDHLSEADDHRMRDKQNAVLEMMEITRGTQDARLF